MSYLVRVHAAVQIFEIQTASVHHIADSLVDIVQDDAFAGLMDDAQLMMRGEPDVDAVTVLSASPGPLSHVAGR